MPVSGFPTLSRLLSMLRLPIVWAMRSPVGRAAVLIFGIDRISKWWVIDQMDLANLGQIKIVPPLLNFVMAWNRGINFGIFASAPEAMRWLLILVAVTISVALVWWVRRRAGQPGAVALAWGAGIVIGGALGNAWDRIQYGAVADFLNMSCCGIVNPYAFNIADVAIFAGAALIAFKA